MIALGAPGCIVNTASMAAKQGRAPFLVDYAASKFAVLGLTQAMAFELAPYGIRLNSVCPGSVATPMQTCELAWKAQLRDTDPETVRQKWIDDTPLGPRRPKTWARSLHFSRPTMPRSSRESRSGSKAARSWTDVPSATHCRPTVATGVVRPSPHHPAPDVLFRAEAIRPHQYGWV